ncbi:MAG: carboxymuconolactone decarboxylase family protein [Acidimicrobiia bacterium]
MRLEQLHEQSLTDEQRALFEAIVANRGGADHRSRQMVGPDGAIRGPFNHMLLAPAIGGPLQELGGVLRSRGTLDDLAREIVILMTARAGRSEFEWWAHVPIAQAVGLTDAQLSTLLDGGVPHVDDAVRRAVIEAAHALLVRGDLDDEEYARAASALGPTTLIELTALVGYYAMGALQMRVFRVEPPDAEPRAFSA